MDISWWDLDARLEQVVHTVRCQHTVLEALKSDVDAIRECLQESGSLTAEMFLARKHRHHFAQMRARYPCAWPSSLETVGETTERIFALAQLIGRRCMAALAMCSRSLSRGIDAAAPELAAALPPMVYVVGGEDDDGQALADVERLCPSTCVWEPSVPLREPRKWCAVTAVSGHVYVVGGWGADDDTLDAVDRFDPWTVSWETLPSMLRRRGAVAATGLAGAVWAVGGQDGQLAHGTAEVLDLAAGGWSLLPPMGRARYAAGSVSLCGRVLAIGGHSTQGQVLSNVECYDAPLGIWVSLPPLRTARAGLAAAAVGGRAYAMGGRDAAGHELCSLECFDPEVPAWEEAAPLAVPRWGLGAAACERRLYALGGTDRAEDASIGACERFYPGPLGRGSVSPRDGAGNWAFIGCLRLPRRIFGATASL